MKLPYEEFDLSGIKTYPLGSRPSKVGRAQFATPFTKGHICPSRPDENSTPGVAPFSG